MLSLFIILCYFVLKIDPTPINNNSTIQHSSTSNNRTGKFFSWLGVGIGVVRFENSVCPGANGLMGTCYTRRQCSAVGGFGSGKCAKNFGACCVVQVGCGGTASSNNTYFSNSGFPNTFVGGSPCSLTIQRCSADICQVRIDFLSLILSQPNGDGLCDNDALVISGAGSSVGRICGVNTGHHIYLDFNNDAPIELTIFTGTQSSARQWNMKISQIGCDSPSRAPSGCLMYYGDLSNTVRSFNYGQTANTVPPTGQPTVVGTRQMVNMNYGVCVRMQPGYCSIQWARTSDPYSFSMSGDTTAVSTTPVTGDLCITDFVIIPNGMFTLNGVATQADRYCDNVFPTVTTSSKPFVLNVVTDGNEAIDAANRGFALTYSQQRCGSIIM